MATQYDPKDHIQQVVVALRSESILDQREITIQSYQTTVPFDFKVLDEGLAWLPFARYLLRADVPNPEHEQ